MSYTIVAKPSAAFSDSAATTTTGTAVSFDGSGSTDANPGAKITGYAWTFGDGTTASGNRTSHRYTRTGTYTVTLTITDSLGQSDSVQHKVKVLAASARPRFSFVRQLGKRWTEPGTPAVNKLPVGTVFWFTLSTKAKLTLTFSLRDQGAQVGAPLRGADGQEQAPSPPAAQGQGRAR